MSTNERSLFTLIGELPDMVSRLVQAEFNRLKTELGWRAQNLGVGILFVLVALLVGQFLIGTLLLAAVFALSLVMPTWAAALVVSGVLLLIILVLAAFAVRSFKNAGEQLDIADSWQEDVDAIKGVGPYDR